MAMCGKVCTVRCVVLFMSARMFARSSPLRQFVRLPASAHWARPLARPPARAFDHMFVRAPCQSVSRHLSQAHLSVHVDYEACTMDYGLWTMDYGLWIMRYGLWTMDYGLCSMSLWTTDHGLWTMDYGL